MLYVREIKRVRDEDGKPHARMHMWTSYCARFWGVNVHEYVKQIHVHAGVFVYV